MSQRWCKQRCFALGEKPRCQSSHVTSPLNELRKRPKGFLRVDFSLLIANFELLSMEIFFACRERFFSFIVCINFRFRANNLLFYRFVYWYITTYWYFEQYQFAVCPLWIDIPSAHVYRIRMCLIKVNQVETSLENISQRFYWAFSPSNVDTYFHCFQILVRTKIMKLSLAGCRS